MSSALVRQALEFVDQEESVDKYNKRGARSRRHRGALVQGSGHPYKIRNKKQIKEESRSKELIAEENIKKLLALSEPTADKKVTEKIVERAIKGKPLTGRTEVKVEEGKSILFPDEPFNKFEQEYFCS